MWLLSLPTTPLEHHEMSEVTHGCTLPDTRVSDYPWLDRTPSSDVAVLFAHHEGQRGGRHSLFSLHQYGERETHQATPGSSRSQIERQGGPGGVRASPREGPTCQICTATRNGGAVAEFAPFAQARWLRVEVPSFLGFWAT